MPRNPDHRGATREEFQRHERERPIMLRSIATKLEAWRYFCQMPECRRAQACVGPHGEQCAAAQQHQDAKPDLIHCAQTRSLTPPHQAVTAAGAALNGTVGTLRRADSAVRRTHGLLAFNARLA